MKLLIKSDEEAKVYSDLEMLGIMQKELTNHLSNMPNTSNDFKMTKLILNEWYRKLANEKRSLSYLNTKEATCVVNNRYILFNSKSRVIMGMCENDVINVEMNGDFLQVTYSPTGKFQMQIHCGSQGLWSQKKKQLDLLKTRGIANGKYVFAQNYGNIYQFKKES